MGPLTADGLISGVSNLISGLFGSSSQSKANATNLQIARETNELNRQLYEDQKAFTVDMWNKNNEYNDPSAQMDRLRSAGINPFMGVGNMTNTSSMPSTPSPSPMQGATVQPETSFAQSLFGGISAGIQQYMSAKLADAQIRNVQADTAGKIIGNDRSAFQFDFDKSVADTQRDMLRMAYASQRHDTDLKAREIAQFDATFADRINQQAAQTMREQQGVTLDQLMIGQAETTLAAEKLKLKNLPSEQMQQLAIMREQVKLLIAQQKMTVAQGRSLLAQAYESGMRANGIKIDNWVKDQTKQWSADLIHYDAIQHMNEANMSYWNALGTKQQYLFDQGMRRLQDPSKLPNKLLYGFGNFMRHVSPFTNISPKFLK